MFSDFLGVIAGEVIVPVVLGYFLPARTREIRRWKLAAWAWLCGAMASFALASSWLAHPAAIGFAAGIGIFSLVASFIASGSASVLRKRDGA
jgi:hypothetical protein